MSTTDRLPHRLAGRLPALGALFRRKPADTPIVPVPDATDYPASHAQRRLWVLSRLGGRASPRWSRSTWTRRVRSSTSTDTALPFTVIFTSMFTFGPPEEITRNGSRRLVVFSCLNCAPDALRGEGHIDMVDAQIFERI
mgnify:CR=1 FL=1